MSVSDSSPPGFDDDHARLREQLGAYALGHLERDDPESTAAVRAHLDGCPSCRGELAEITPLVGLLGGVDPAAFGSPPFPPPELGSRIRDAVARERAGGPVGAEPRGPRRRASTPRRRWLPAAVAAVLVLALGAGVVAGRASAPDPPSAGPVPLQPVSLRPVEGSSVQVDSAGIVAHTWGVELRMEGSGFADGEVFSAMVVGTSGRLQPAGRFLGTGEQTMTCNLQSAVMAADARAIVVQDDEGRPVLRATL